MCVRPGKIHVDHVDLDFNDEAGCDGAYWKNAKANGKTFHFMHFIDEGTLYHTGAPGGRSVEELTAVDCLKTVGCSGQDLANYCI